MSSIVPPIAPTMALNFEQCRSNADAAAMIKRYGLTFGRASDGAYLDRAGVLRFATTNEPRVDFSGAGLCRGFLPEPTGANLVSRSADFTTAWTTTESTVVANDFRSPDGTVNADKLRTNTNSAEHSVSQGSLSFIAGTAYTFSVWMRAGEISFGFVSFPSGAFGSVLRNYINLNTGAVTLAAGVTGDATPFPNGWYLFRVSATATVTVSSNVRVGLTNSDTSTTSTGANATDGIYLYGAKLKTGIADDSYIPTAATATTRAADTLSGASLSSLIGQSELNIFAKVDTRNYNPGTARVIVDLYEDANNYIRLQKTTGNAFELVVVAGGSTQAQITDATGSRSGIFQLGARVKTNDFGLWVNGSTVGTDTSGTVPAVSKMGGGHAIDASLNASLWFGDRIGKLYLFNRGLTTAVNQNITRNI